jgi:hypothetical protein
MPNIRGFHRRVSRRGGLTDGHAFLGCLTHTLSSRLTAFCSLGRIIYTGILFSLQGEVNPRDDFKVRGRYLADKYDYDVTEARYYSGLVLKIDLKLSLRLNYFMRRVIGILMFKGCTVY